MPVIWVPPTSVELSPVASNQNGAGAVVNCEASKPRVRQAVTGAEASLVPGRHRQPVADRCTNSAPDASNARTAATTGKRIRSVFITIIVTRRTQNSSVPKQLVRDPATTNSRHLGATSADRTGCWVREQVTQLLPKGQQKSCGNGP